MLHGHTPRKFGRASEYIGERLARQLLRHAQIAYLEVFEVQRSGDPTLTSEADCDKDDGVRSPDVHSVTAAFES